MTLLVGADPELFVKKGGKFFSAYGLIKGTKEAPWPVDKGAVQVDGHALEFNIKPAASMDEFVNHIDMVMAQLRNMVPKEYTLTVEPCAFFDADYLEAQPDEANALGCNPDFNAYTMTTNPPPLPHRTMRTAAGHIHMGWCEGSEPFSDEHFEYCCELVKHMDCYLGLPSVILDKDTERKKMYGKAGCFRPKHYGMEYRVNSNWWLTDPDHMKLVYENTTLGYNRFVAGEHLHQVYNDVEDIINTNNRNAALAICKEAGIPIGL